MTRHHVRAAHAVGPWTFSAAFFVCALLGLLTLAASAGCSRATPGYYGTTQPKHGPDEVWSSLISEPEYLDPGTASETVGSGIIINLFAGLTQPHPVTLEPMPDVAERWDVSDDGTRYVFHLRATSWSDGVPVTAGDFEYAWRRVLDPRTGSKYGSFLYGVKYAELFNRRALIVRSVGTATEAELRKHIESIAPLELVRMAPELDAAFIVVGGEEAARPALRERLLRELSGQAWQGHELRATAVDSSLVGVHAQDDHTLVVELESPLPYFLHITKYHTAMPVPRHLFERLVKAGINPELWTRPEHIVSNGAYLLTEAKFRQFMLLTKNPRYWDASHVKLQRVRLLMIDSANTILNMYKAGEIDSIGSAVALPAEFLESLRPQRDFHTGAQLALYFYWLNTAVPPLDDVRVRRALSLATDRQSMVTHVTRAGQLPTADIVPDGLAGYAGLHSPLFDPERARALLREAGYSAAHPLPPIALVYNTAESHKQLAEALQAMWHKHLGIDVEIENQEWKVYLKSLRAHEFQIARHGWIGDYPDPFTFLELFGSHNGNNHSNWHNTQYDDMLEHANRERDPQRRLALLQEAERMVADAVPVVPLYVYTRSELIKPYLRGHVLNSEARHLYKYWWIDRRWYTGVPTTELPHGFPEPPTASARVTAAPTPPTPTPTPRTLGATP